MFAWCLAALGSTLSINSFCNQDLHSFRTEDCAPRLVFARSMWERTIWTWTREENLCREPSISLRTVRPRRTKRRCWISGGSEVLYSSVCATHTFGPGHSLVQELHKSVPPGLKLPQRAVAHLSVPSSRNWNDQIWTSASLRVTFRVVSN